ncbi:MFS general substrate transporter [Panus rudis PR-1116 ss-1]|nr:MFS general substrate transporter [Panus rudis PR-1116 ss-1]
MSADLEKTISGPNSIGDRNAHSDVKGVDVFEVSFSPEEDPKNLPAWRKWLAVLVINAGAICVTSSSSMAAFAQAGIQEEWGISLELSILGVSLFTIGMGLGPFVVGAIAELVGQRPIYLGSFFLVWVFTWPVAFAKGIAVYSVFRFLGGLSASAFLSIGGGTISDLFDSDAVATPMASYVVSTFIGPNFGPIFTGYIAQNVTWRWIYRVLIIWEFVEFLALFVVPETYLPVLLRRKAQRKRKETGDNRYHAPGNLDKPAALEQLKTGAWSIIELMLFDTMAMLLDIWLALILGIVYLASQAFPIIFAEGHGFKPGSLGLTFIGLNIGFIIALSTQPLWNRYQVYLVRKFGGNPPPEIWLKMGQLGAVLTPIGLYIMAFTTFNNVHWIGPIIGSVPFGTGICYVYTSTFTYFATAYQTQASAVMSGSAALRATFAGCFPLFANQMYHRLGTVGATSLLAGLTTVMAPLPFIFERVGARLRAKSRFASHDTT